MPTIQQLITATMLMISLVINAQECNPNIKDEWQDTRYTNQDNGTILDKYTNLTWKKCAQGLSGNECATGSIDLVTWQQALQQADSSTFAGESDWRLPNITELLSLAKLTCDSPAINKKLFPNTNSAFWSSSPNLDYPNYARMVYFSNGSGSVADRNYPLRVQLVR